jgi:tetratricopeptide (TPR) repeat protein
MNHFRIRVLDHSRRVVFERVIDKAPNPSTEIVRPTFLAETNSAPIGKNQPLILRLPLNPRKGAPARFRVSVASSDLAELDREEKMAAAMKLTDPWAMLAAAYHLIGNQQALDKLLNCHPAAASSLGDLYAAAKDWDQAIAEYRKLVADQPAHIALLTKLATAYQDAGRTREAVSYLDKLSAANPKDAELSLKAAALQAWFGLHKELAVTRRRVLASAKGTNEVITLEGAAKTSCTLPSTGKAELEAALALARSAVELANGGGWNLLALGMAEYGNGNYPAADKALLAAAEAGPNDSHVMGIAAFYRAMSLHQQGKKDEARKLAIAATPKIPPLPKDENNPLAGDAHQDDLILWLAYKEAKAMIRFDAAPPGKAASRE